MQSLDLLNCTKCRVLCKTRTQVVMGYGNPQAKLMFVGEAPGQDEDIIGRPFVGRCGDLLTKMCESAGIVRDNIYITNTIRCNPITIKNNRKSNREPLDEEIENCKEWLWKELNFVNPKVIVTFGKIPTRVLLKKKKSIKLGDLVGRVHCNVFQLKNGTEPIIIPSYHPSYLLVYSKELITDTIDILKGANMLTQNININK